MLGKLNKMIDKLLDDILFWAELRRHEKELRNKQKNIGVKFNLILDNEEE